MKVIVEIEVTSTGSGPESLDCAQKLIERAIMRSSSAEFYDVWTGETAEYTVNSFEFKNTENTK